MNTPDNGTIASMLIGEVADLLCCEEATGEDFFVWLQDECLKRGYQIEARQRGIFGTHIRLVKSPKEEDNLAQGKVSPEEAA